MQGSAAIYKLKVVFWTTWCADVVSSSLIFEDIVFNYRNIHIYQHHCFRLLTLYAETSA